MAVGDAAAAAGLKTYTGADKVNTTHVALNQLGDYVAGDRSRLTTLEERINTSPAAILRTSAGQATSATSNAFTAMRWNIEEFDRGATHNNAAATDLIAPKKGLVLVHSTVKFATQQERIVRTRLMRNGVYVEGTLMDDQRGAAGAEPIVTMTTLVYANAGDVFTVEQSAELTGVAIRTSQCRFGLGYLTIG